MRVSYKALKPRLPSQRDLDALSEDEGTEDDGQSNGQASCLVDDDETLTAEQVEAQLDESYPLQPNSVPQSLSQVPCFACPFYSEDHRVLCRPCHSDYAMLSNGDTMLQCH